MSYSIIDINRESFNDCIKNLNRYSLTIKNELNAFEKNKKNYDNVRDYIENKEQINHRLKIRKVNLKKEMCKLEVKEKDEEDYFSDIDSIKDLYDVNNLIEIRIKKNKQKNDHEWSLKVKSQENRMLAQASSTHYNNKNKPLLSKEYSYQIRKHKLYKEQNTEYKSIIGPRIKSINNFKNDTSIINSTDTRKEMLNTTRSNKRKLLFPMIHYPNNSNKINPDLDYSKEHKTVTSTLYQHKKCAFSLKDLLLPDNKS